MTDPIYYAIDPGSEQSAYVVYAPRRCHPILDKAILPNIAMLAAMYDLRKTYPSAALIIETPVPRGQPMYTQLVTTILWIGRFWEAAGKDFAPLDRTRIKHIITGSTKTKDSHVRAALLSRFPSTGGGSIPQVGTKARPGPLYGFSKDLWAALAVAIAYSIQKHSEDHVIQPDSISKDISSLPF